jgi:hypothetical protein
MPNAQLIGIRSRFRKATVANRSSVPTLRYRARVRANHRGCVMTEHTELAITPRDRFLKAAEKELIAFERREREFLKKDREERAAKLQFPLDKILTRN